MKGEIDNRGIWHSVLGCLMIYLLVLGNVAFAGAGSALLDNDTLANNTSEKVNEDLSEVVDIVLNESLDDDVETLNESLVSDDSFANDSDNSVENFSEDLNDSLVVENVSLNESEELSLENETIEVSNETVGNVSNKTYENNLTSLENESLDEINYSFSENFTVVDPDYSYVENESLDDEKLKNDSELSENNSEENVSEDLFSVQSMNLMDTSFSIQSMVNGVSREGYLTQSGVYNLVGTDEFIPLNREILNLSHAFIISPNLMKQENTTPSTNGDPSTNSDDSFVSLYLYNSTHIRAQRGASDDGPVVVDWQVIEAMDEEFSVQRGNLEYTGDLITINDTISESVNVENSMSWFYVHTTDYSKNNGDVMQFYSDVIDNNTIQFTREEAGTSTALSFRWEVVEWNLEKIDNYAKGYTGQITGSSDAPDCFNIGTSVDKSSSFLFHQSHAINDNDGGLDTSTRAGYIQDSSTVCFYDYDGSYTSGVKWYLIDFKDVGQREESINNFWGSEDYIDSVNFLNSYETNRTLFFVSGTSNGDGTAKPRHTQWSYLMGSPQTTGLGIERVYGGQDREYAWQVMELPYYENSEAPSFSNFRVNSSYVGNGEVGRFSVDVVDLGESVVSVNGSVDSVLRSFSQGSGNEWFFDYTCNSNKEILFDFVEAVDSGRPLRYSNDTFSVNLVCDVTNPVVDFVSPDTPEDSSSIGNDYFSVNVSVVEDNFENITYRLYNDSGLINNTSYSSFVDSVRFDGLREGNYYYEVEVYDRAGQSDLTSMRSLYVDSENPLVEFSGVTYESGEIISGDSVDIQVNVTEDNEANITFYLYDEFGDLVRTPVAYTDNRRSVSYDLLDDGLYYYNVTVYDDFGHSNSTETRNITLDNIDPVVSYEGGVEDDDSYFSRDFVFVNVSYVENYYENITFYLWNSTGLVDSVYFLDETLNYNFTGLSDSEYFYNVSVCDIAGNCGNSEGRKITLDNVNPVVDFGVETEQDNFNFSRDWIYVDSVVNEDNFENITFNLFGSSGSLVDSFSYFDSSRSHNFTDLNSDIYDYNITVYDKAGNVGTSVTRSIGLDLVGPSITVFSPQSKAYGDGTDMPLTYDVVDSISGVDSCWYSLNAANNVSVDCLSSSSFSVGDGNHNLVFYSNDSFGNLNSKSVSFLVSTTGPAITLNDPRNDTFYSTFGSVLFNYSTVDPDGVQTCSLYGDWNGGWHLNQTDYSFGLIGDETNRSCSDEWGFSCGGGPTESGDNTFDSCISDGSSSSYEYINEVYLSDTEVISGGELTATCELGGAYENDYVYMWYYNGSGWRQIQSWIQPTTTNGLVNFTASFNVDENVGTHWLRCGLTYNSPDSDECADSETTYNDNDDVSFSVVEAKEEGNFSVDISSEGAYKWNVECNDSLSYISRAIENNSFGFDLTDPVVNFGDDSLGDNSRIGENNFYVDADVVEANFANITFYLYKGGTKVSSKTYDNQFNHTFSGLTDGVYEYNISAYDKSGRSGFTSTRSVELDLTSPSGSSNTPEDNYFTGEAFHNLTATVNDSVELKDATLFVFNSTGKLVYSSLLSLTGLTGATIGVVYEFLYDDVFDWFYRVRDSVDNEYNTTAHSIEIDTTSPEVSFISPTEPDSSVVLRDWIFVNTSVYEKNYKNMTFYLYDASGSIVSPSPNTFSDTTRSINWTLLADGDYYYNVTSYDLAHNFGESETRKIVLDTTFPVVSFGDGTRENNSVISSTSIFVNTSVVEANEDNITFNLYNGTGYPLRENTFYDSRRSITWNLLSEGVYYYDVVVYDEVGLKGETGKYKLTLDNTDPVVLYSDGVEINNSNKSQNWIFVNATVSEENFDNITFSLYNETSFVENKTFLDFTKEYNFTDLEDSVYYYNIFVYDKAGNVENAGQRVITLDTVNPLVSFIPNTEDDLVIRNRDWVYLNASVFDKNFKEIKFSLYDSSGIYSEQSFETFVNEYNFTNLPDDNYKYNVTVYDWAGNLNYTETRNIGLDSDAPNVEIVSPKSKTYGYNESLVLENSVYDKVSGVESCWWNIDGGMNQTVPCNDFIFFNTTVDSHVINFYANDTFGNLGYDSVSFFISVTGPAIELVFPKNDTFYSQSQNIDFGFAASDPDLVDECSLYGDWNGGWHKNETYVGNWYDLGYKHRSNLTINYDSSFVDYPAYFRIPINYTHPQDFTDLRFFNGSCDEEQDVRLAHDVEYYNSTEAHVWVNVGEISSGDTQVCMYHGNDNSFLNENVSGVWDSRYSLVYDMQTNGLDLTSNNNDVVATVGSPVADNSFGYGVSFSNGNAWDMSNLGYWESEWFTRTHEVLFKTNSNVNDRQVLLAEGGGTNGYMMYILNGYFYVRWWSENSGFSGDEISYPVLGDTVYHVVSSFNYPGNYSLYVNGKMIDTRVAPSEIRAHSGDGGIGYTGSTGKDFHDLTNSQGYYFLGTIYDLKSGDFYADENIVNLSYSMIFNSEEILNYSEEEDFVGFNINLNEEGNYLWNVECNDTIGYSAFGLDNYSFIIDVTNPQVFFGTGTEADNEVVGRTWIYVDSNLIENNFENITFNLYDSSGLVDSQSFFDETRNVNFTNLDSGVYDYNITAYDRAGRVGYSSTRNIKLDLTSPEGQLEAPSSGSYVRNLVQNLTTSFSDSTGLLNATLYVLNGTGSIIYNEVVELGGVLSATVGVVYNFLNEGIYSWFYSVEDVVGNVYNTTSNDLTVDVTSPFVDYSLGVEESGVVVKNETIFVNVTYSDLYFSNLTFDFYDSNGQVFGHTFSDGTSEITSPIFSDGIYYYNVTARDLAGNENYTETRNITLDNLAPKISFNSQTKESGSYISGDSVSVYVDVVEANEKNRTFNLYDENGSEVRSSTFYDGRNSVTWNLLSEGIYYYNVTVYDEVGHYASTSTRSIEIDDTLPVVSYGFGSEDDGSYFSRDWIYFSVNVVEENFENVTLNLYNDSGFLASQTFSDTTRDYNFTGLLDGSYYYNATAYDKAGNLGLVDTRSINLDNINPLISFSLNTEVDGYNKTENWVFADVNLAENNFANISFELRNSDDVFNLTTYDSFVDNINWTELPSDRYWYNVTAYDLAGNYNSTEVRSIGLDYLGPNINLLNPKAKAYGYNESLPLDYSVSDNIVGVDSCWYNLDNGNNVSIDCLGSSSFDTNDGSHTVHFYSNDSFGNVGYENVTFLVSTTGPAIQLITPEDDSFYDSAQELFFSYTAEDPDLTQSCSLWGDWNGGWHLNQTDSDWDKRDFSSRTCSEVWGFDCGAGPAESASNTFDGCSTGTGADESVEEIYLDVTSAVAGQEINVTCEFDPYTSSDDLFIWYYNGTGWRKLFEELNMGSNGLENRSVSFVVDDNLGEHWIRCGINYGTGTDTDECMDSSSYYDNDDISFTVIEARESGNFTVNLSEEGTSEWNVFCNDSLGYVTSAVSNYSVTFDVTDPVVYFGSGTLENLSNVSQEYIFVNSSIVENNFESVEFFLYNETSLVDNVWFNDSTRDYTFINLDDGVYYYNITVFDSAGRSGSSATRTVMLDTTSPEGDLNSPADDYVTNNATQNLTASFSDENSLVEAVLYVFNESGLVDRNIISLSGKNVVVSYLYTFLADGIYDWFYQAEDYVGNLYNTTNHSLVIDTTSPIVNFSYGTEENNSYVSNDFIYVNASVNEVNFENITFYLYNDEGIVSPSPNTFTNSKRDINWTNLDEDRYYYNFDVWDSAGNFNSSEFRVVTLDRTLPSVSYSEGTASNFANLSQNWIYVNTSIEDENFANVTYRLYNETGLENETTYDYLVEGINWTNLYDGDYSYNVTVYDKAGHSKSLLSRNLNLDTTLPLVSYTANTLESGVSVEKENIYIEVSSFDQNFKNVKYSLYSEGSLINETVYDSEVNSINFSVSSENETYEYNVSVYDFAGNVRSTDTRNITLIDVTSPSLVLNSPENTNYSYSEGIRLDYDVFDVHLDSCWYNIDGGENLTLPNCMDTSINVADFSSHNLTIYVNDTMGYMNSSSVEFFVNSSLIFTPTYKVVSGSSFVDGYSEASVDQIDMSKSFILHNTRGVDNGPNSLNVISKFLDVNTIAFENYDSGEPVYVEWNLVVGPNISVQRGEVEFGAESVIETGINSVNLSRSFIVVNSRLNSDDNSDNVDSMFTAEFIDDSTVRFERGLNGSSGELSFQVVEWEGVNVESGSLEILGGSSQNSSSINSVNLNNSFLIFSRNLNGSLNVGDSFVKGGLESENNVSFERSGTFGNVSLSYFVVESNLFDVQSEDYTHLVTSDAQDISIFRDLINSSRAFNLNSHKNSGSGTLYSSASLTQKIKNNNTLTLQKGTGVGSGVSNWFAVEMKDLNSPVVNLLSPADNHNFSSYVVPSFSYEVEDENAIKNCSLWGDWNGGWHLNETVYSDSDFSNVNVSESGFYKWRIECYDIYGNIGVSENRTFGAFLPPTEPKLVNITQSKNDGSGDVFISWNESNDALTYRIYAGSDLNNLVLVDEISETNYTDSSFSGNRRKFYRVEAWNPSSVNESSEVFGAHVYTLNHNTINPKGSITNRNWIGFPTNFTYLKNANDTLNEVNGITSISKLDASTQKQVTCSDFSCPESFSCTDTACNFDLKAGEGYEVILSESESSSVNWSGVGIVNEPVSIDLVYDETGTRFNKNWISMYAGTSLETATNLEASILGDDAITRWNSETQSSEGLLGEVCFPWGLCGPLGKDFEINAEEGYEVSVTQDSVWLQE